MSELEQAIIDALVTRHIDPDAETYLDLDVERERMRALSFIEENECCVPVGRA